jgi:hypothetical protein
LLSIPFGGFPSVWKVLGLCNSSGDKSGVRIADLMAEMMAGVRAIGGSMREMRFGTAKDVIEVRCGPGLAFPRKTALTRKRHSEEFIASRRMVVGVAEHKVMNVSLGRSYDNILHQVPSVF